MNMEHELTASAAWEIYSKGIQPDDSTEDKLEYTKAIHRMRQATKEGYCLCRLDEAIREMNVKAIEKGEYLESAEIEEILRRACE